jgi:hypothetical protein
MMPANSVGGAIHNDEGAPVASRVAELLCLAAAPSFAIMALLATLTGGPMGRLCSSPPLGSLSGMTVMYLLMSLFHSPPWLKLVPGVGEAAAVRLTRHPTIPQKRST